jgi:predicted RND superfamily exporter protein
VSSPSRRLAQLVHRRAAAITLLSLVFAVLAGFSASKLGIDGRMRRLLPDDYPSVANIDLATARLGNQSDLYVTIQSPSPEANRELGEAVVAALADHPQLRWVQLRRDWTFFEDHALLYAELDDLLQLRREVIGRIRREVAARAYGDLSTEEERDTDKADDDEVFDPDHIRARYGLDEKLPEYREADEGRLLVVWSRPLRSATDVEFGKALQADVLRIVEALSPTSYHPQMTVKLDGAFAFHSRQVERLSTEIWAGTAFAVFGVLACIALFFRSLRAVALVLGPVILASLGALGFAALAFGDLNLVTAFIFAILVGLGIDFGIHLLARYRDERQRGLDDIDALTLMYSGTGRSTLAGAMGTALAFGSLAVADFEGFSQFGIVAAVGICFSLLMTGIVMPAWMLLLERRLPWPPRTSRTGLVLGFVPRSLGAAWLVAAAVAAVAAYGAWNAPSIEFEYDFDKLGPQREERSGPEPASYKDAIGRSISLAPAVAVSPTREQAERLYRQLAVLVAMTPAEAEALTPIDPRRIMALRRAVDPDYDGPPPKRVQAKALDGAPAAGDDGTDDDDWDDDDELYPFEDEDLADPVFVALETKVADAKAPAGPVRAQLEAYDATRRGTMADRLAAVSAVQAFVPEDQTDKLTVIADIRRRIDAKYAQLTPKSREQLDEWKTQLSVAAPIDIDELPAWVQAPFIDSDGEVGRFVVFRTSGAKADVANATVIYDAFRTLEDIDGPVTTAADFYVVPEIFDAVGRDGPRVLVLALIAMLITAALTLRSIGGAAAVALVVATTMAWLLGGMALLGAKLSIFNMVALPLLIGMAQDDALHVYQRWQEEGRANLRTVLRETGGAVAVTSASTMFGFAGILMANHRGLVSLATTAVVGMGLAWLAAVTVLPAALAIGEHLQKRR